MLKNRIAGLASHLSWRLLLIFGAAVVLRLVAYHFNDYVGNADQVCYLRNAEGLLAGRLRASVFPPGYPLFISAALALGASPDRAAQLVSLVLGCLLVPLGYLLARLAFDKRTALFAAAILAFHPELVRRSADGMSEATFMFVVYGGMLLLLFAASRASRLVVPAVLGGVLLGVGYLTRPEGLVYAGALLLALATMGAIRRKPRLLATATAASLPVFLLVAGYVVLVIKPQTGHWALTAKSTAWQRSYELSEQQGEALRYSVRALSLGHYALVGSRSEVKMVALHGVMSWLKRSAKDLYKAYWQVLPRVLDYLLVALFGLGCLAAWRRPAGQPWPPFLLAPLVMLFVVPVVALTARLFVPLIPCFVLWAAYGLSSVHEWTPSRVAARRFQLAMLAALFLVYLKPLVDTVENYYSGGVPLEEKTAGAWLNEHLPANAVLMERKSSIGFYAHRSSDTTPYASLPAIIKYARSRDIGYLVVSERYLELRPQLAPLLRVNKYPGLSLIYDQPTPRGWTTGARVRIFRIEPRDGPA